ncbi:uncharacterized protein GGS22DRAFT_195138 [Annulohypoxylon maeteangense]|uniref:uncharacterized protein n=1 Tax=Annulohypoxylon maeteangense TaxID=1927788 RepID=UPI002008A415|nr:uncharacterized protein GGS22DRAFT_195138 [Annulohypoxylon maeteangense]KAI0883343.1 hypothetical protein GGS22DRAFT_195138 [Annulohypoxylon maeteangense]
MSAITSVLVRRTGLNRGGIRVTAIASASQRRSTSWIPWEQPNPTLYMQQPNQAHPKDPLTDTESPPEETLTDTLPTNNVRKVGEATVAPATATVGPGTQEVSTSGKTVPSSIQAGSIRVPSTQTRTMHTASGSTSSTPTSAPALLHLPTTLLRIPGVPATWPGETPPHPDQPRIRKQRITVIHEFGSYRAPTLPSRPVISSLPLSTPTKQPTGEDQNEEVEKGDDKALPTLQIHHTIPPIDFDPHPSLTFEKAVARYMDGVKEREEALAAVELHSEGGDLEISRRALAEVEKAQWGNVVLAALGNLPVLPEKGEEEKSKDEKEGKGEDKGRS